MPPCLFYNYGESLMKDTGRHENDFTARGYSFQVGALTAAGAPPVGIVLEQCASVADRLS